jgi:hypothetical protein
MAVSALKVVCALQCVSDFAKVLNVIVQSLNEKGFVIGHEFPRLLLMVL